MPATNLNETPLPIIATRGKRSRLASIIDSNEIVSFIIGMLFATTLILLWVHIAMSPAAEAARNAAGN